MSETEFKARGQNSNPELSYVLSTLLAYFFSTKKRMCFLVNDNNNNITVIFIITQYQYIPSSKIKLGNIQSIPEI